MKEKNPLPHNLQETFAESYLERKEIFRQISQIRHNMQCFLIEEGFIEVEIPVFSPSPSLNYGGIKLQTEKLEKPVFLTTAGTPYIRRLLTEGLEKVFCISKNFRDDRPDTTHYPEFETLNCGITFYDYNYLMFLIENMVENALIKSTGDNKSRFGLDYLDFKSPWARLTFKEATLKFVGKEVDIAITSEQELEEILEKKIAPRLTQPTFLTEYPQSLFGPARVIDNHFKERAELYAGGIEIGNISTFENDSGKLEEWYRRKMELKNVGWEQFELERLHLESVKQGLPFCATGAIGLTRLYMVLLGKEHINSVVTFPWLGERTT